MFEQADRYLQDFHGWGLTASLVLIALMLVYIFRLKDPSHLERAMARKREKEVVEDAINKALHDAFVAERLSADAYIRWGNKIGRDYNLPDLVAIKKANSKGQKEQYGLKVRILQRLSKMGVDVQTKLANMRRSSKPKKPKLIIPKLPG